MLAALLRPAMLALPVLFAAMSIASAPQAAAQDNKVLKVGTLKLIHGISAYFYEKFVPAGYTVEVIPFESPTDGKNAVLTGTVDTCIHGIAAFLLGAAAGEPVVIVANANNGGMAVMAGVNTDIKIDQGPQGQEGRDLAGLDAGGRDPRAAAHGGHDDQGHPADPAAVQRHGGGARARRRRRLCRRRAGGRHQPRQRHRPAGRVSLLDADRTAQHDPVREREGGQGEPRAHQAGRRHAPQGGRLRHGQSAADRRRWRCRSSASRGNRSSSRCRTSSSPGSSTTCSCSAPRPTRS